MFRRRAAGEGDAAMTENAPVHLKHTFGSIKRSGPWQVPSRIALQQRMGSTELDFTAEFDTEQVALKIDMIGGSVELRVPENMRVESTLATTLASFQDHRKLPQDTPGRSLTISGRAVWGSVEVRGPKM